MSEEKLRSASSSQAVPLGVKAREALKQFQFLWSERGPGRRFDFSNLELDFAEYSAISRKYGGFDLEPGVTAFEIGCGQRPHRLFFMLSNEVDAYGIDMDRVVLSIGDLIATYRANGFERTAKTSVRYMLFDSKERRALKLFLSTRLGRDFHWPSDRIFHGNAADPALWPARPLDFILSEDVFEHIPPDQLPTVCKICASRLSARGIALIRPMVFTGIRGGHHVDWYNTRYNSDRNCPPWDHLRGTKFPVNTYLNKLRRDDYRRLFSEHFVIVAEWTRDPDCGRAFMTDEIRAELAEYSDEELFSNHVAFVLKVRK